MPAVAVLPKIFRWVFTVFAVLAALGVCAVLVAMIIDPKLPPGTHFGPLPFNMLGQPGTVALLSKNGDADFSLTVLRGSLSLFVARAGGLIEVVKHHALPVILINLVFLAVLFDLLRRLFRNVGKGESFSRQSVYLVQFVGVSLLIYSLVLAFAENWFAEAILTYLAQHAVVTVSGSTLHLPEPRGFTLPHGSGGSPIFFSGLLVLALSEVFRQGLALKSENDLTV